MYLPVLFQLKMVPSPLGPSEIRVQVIGLSYANDVCFDE